MRFALILIGVVLVLAVPGATQMLPAFAPGDLVVSFEAGPVQWRNPDGALKGVLQNQILGPMEGMRFDAAGNLYVAHWCGDQFCRTGNTIERFNTNGVSQGSFGSGYNCNPHAIAFDAAGNAYVGQADCTGNVLQFAASGDLVAAYSVAPENRGSFWIDLAPDNCTLFYTSWGPNVKRFNVCTNTQLADFNQVPLPGGETHGLRILPDGGVLVSSGAVIARLDAAGALVQTYTLPTGEAQYWAGLDLVGDGTFWAANYYASLWFDANVYRFDLATGAIRGRFNTESPSTIVVDVRVSRGVGP